MPVHIILIPILLATDLMLIILCLYLVPVFKSIRECILCATEQAITATSVSGV